MAKDNIKWQGTITNIQGNVLEKLARYKFLTMSQFLRLDIGTTQYNYLTMQIKSLRDRRRALVGCHNFHTPQPKKGRVESMYFLTKFGREALISELGIEEKTIKMPIGKTMAYKDYWHRRFTIDYEIQLDKWGNSNGVIIPFFDTYFDKVGNNRIAKNLRAKTRITLSENEYFIPDGLYYLHKEDAKRLHLMEMYNGKDTGRVVRQLHKHAQALSSKCTHKQFNLEANRSYTITLVFEHESIMQATIERIQQEGAFHKIAKYFLCKSIEDVREGDFDNWIDLNGEVVPFR